MGDPQNGVVKFFNGARGFGFITPDSGNANVFVHVGAVRRAGMTSLTEGQRISFRPCPTPRARSER
ncbi:MAG: cold-shock protein [Hyphomonadaceae bacterium]